MDRRRRRSARGRIHGQQRRARPAHPSPARRRARRTLLDHRRRGAGRAGAGAHRDERRVRLRAERPPMIDDAPPRPVAADEQVDGSVTARVSNEMVRIYKEVFGRGPTRARTAFAGPDAMICTLENSFTPAERTLAEMGEHQRLRDVRLFFQYAREEDFRSTIEAITGRRVRAFVSGTDTQNDISAEVFYFEPS